MAYNGYLIKIGSHIIPNKFIRADTFKETVNTQDLDPWTDENGYLHRNPLPHKPVKCEWNMPTCKQPVMQEYLSILRSVWGENSERKAECEIYVAEWDRYYVSTFYMPDFTFEMSFVDAQGNIMYNETRFALIEY